MKRGIWLWLAMAAFGVSGCGDSSSDPVSQTGGLTILIGDGPLDVDAVFIDIDRVVLLGDDGQIVLTEDATPLNEPINLLNLRNVTELMLDVEDVPVGTYSKIRLYINSLKIVENTPVGEEPEPDDGVDAQLPANGKIDLNSRGGFEISPGEDLVVQIDVHLDSSVHTVLTGNSKYRFRPVVFIDVLDQRANLRLTKLFGIANAVSGNTFGLCKPDDPEDCSSVEILEGALELSQLDDDSPLANGNDVHAFGHFRYGATGGLTFRALAVVIGAEDTVAQIDGEVMVVSDVDSSIASIGGMDVMPVEDALLLDGLGNPIEAAMDGQQAESWAQVDPMMDLPVPFPSFLTQVGSALDEESVAGVLAAIDGDTLTIRTDDLEEVCVIVNGQTQIQQIDGYAIDASTLLINLAELSDLMGEPEIEAFGSFEEGVAPACLEASVVVIET